MKGRSSCFRREFGSFLINQIEQPAQPSTSNDNNSREQKVGRNKPRQQGKKCTQSPRQTVFPSTMVLGEPQVAPSESCIRQNMEFMLSTQEESYDNGTRLGKRGRPPLWNPKIQTKKRSKLPQYPRKPWPSPIGISELHEVSMLQRLQDRFVDQDVGDSINRHGEPPKYDDLFIYEKCNFVYPNEIGLGAMLYTPSVSLQMSSELVDRQKKGDYVEGGLADGDCASSCMLFDVPIHGPSDDDNN